MINGKYISAMTSLLFGIMMLPGMEDMLKVVLIVFVILIAVAMQLFFFWGGVKKALVKELYPDLMSQLYKNDDFIEFLIEKQKQKSKHAIRS